MLDRDPDLMLWLLATELKAGYLPRRALGTGILLALFARRLGLGDDDTLNLLLAGLLLDIGKLTVPVTILAKPGPLTGAERAFIRRHVRRGLYLARSAADLPESVEEAIIGHHERLDGSGYPRGCTGTQIPLAGRMAGIVDTYDALTLDRRYAVAVAAPAALRVVNRGRNRHFDTALLRTFIRALGLYPTGSWVQLADGRLGVVRAQTPGDPLRPRVALVSDSAGRPLRLDGRLWSPIRRGDISRGLAPHDVSLRPEVVAPALQAAAAA
jgi:HD-GYP domain-containing protein (c-di-GMP phosphodiesterase class II)